jgi:anaerobic magnesium-protoporphyrin IX monomethyl ester cyclase
MKIALLYPPPWKITAPGESFDYGREGPPEGYQPGDLDPDFHQIPYGLLSLGAQSLRAGYPTKVFNFSGFAWSRIEQVIAALDADLFGMSCWTSNRRGVAYVAQLIKRHHPRAHVVIGGPHATPLAKEMLAHHAEIDSVVLGEGDATFMELVERLERGEPSQGIAGTWYRDGDALREAPERASIRNLDELSSPHEWFDTQIVMTSRGCPWQCTFCGAETSWGRGFRGQSVGYVLDALEQAVNRASVKMLQIKDDTFTTNKKRVIELCRGIRERKLEFVWSCDTRVDVLSDELLYEMRLAGCQRLSLGVESGSPQILKAIDKKITVEEILESTELAKKYGIQARFYMMLGNRGETAETFRQTLDFLERARPHQYLFSCLSIYPGTIDFHDAEKQGWLDREVFFTQTFQELKTPFDASDADAALMNDWFQQNKGIRDHYRPSVEECRAVLERLGGLHTAELDLAGAYYREQRLDQAELHARRALELGHPLPGLALNYLACIAFRRGDIAGMQELFLQAARRDPQHWVLIENVQRVRAWLAQAGPDRGLTLELEAHHEFALLERNVQPSLPGPLPDDFAEWQPVERTSAPLRPQGGAKRLRVVG